MSVFKYLGGFLIGVTTLVSCSEVRDPGDYVYISYRLYGGNYTYCLHTNGECSKLKEDNAYSAEPIKEFKDNIVYCANCISIEGALKLDKIRIKNNKNK